MSTIYDAGALIAAERGDRRWWADHRARLEMGIVPTTTTPVVAQVSRSPRQVPLRRVLRGCRVEDFERDQMHDVGAALAAAGTSDVVDAHLMVVAAAQPAVVLTSDPDGLRLLADAIGADVEICPV